MRHQGRGLVEAGPLGCREGVVATRIKIKLDVRPLRESSLDLLPRLRRREAIEFREVENHRALDLRGLAQIGFDADAIIANRAIDIGSRRDQISELAAETETQRADLADAFRPRAQYLQRVRGILDRLVGIEALVITHRLAEIGFGVAELDAGLHPPEQIGHENDVAFFGIML